MTGIITKKEYLRACELLGEYNLSSAKIHFLGDIVNSYIDQTPIEIQKRKIFKKLYFTLKNSKKLN